MNINRAFIAVLFLLSSFFPSHGKTDVLYPPDLTLAGRDKITIYGFSGEDGPVEGEVNFVRKFSLEDGEFFRGDVELTPGMNIIKLGKDTIRVFTVIGSDIPSFRMKSGDDELTFNRYTVHPALEEGCGSCHKFEGQDIALIGGVKELCFECHEDPTKGDAGGGRTFIHSPVLEEECTECHDPHFSKNKQLLTQEHICLECHDDKDPGQEGYATVHGPVKKMMCVSCHSPHASPNPYQLKEPGSRLCRECHRKPHRLHILSAVEGSSTRVPEKFPREKNGDFSCLGCHEPHFSKNRRLFREEESKLCMKCHKM